MGVLQADEWIIGSTHRVGHRLPNVTVRGLDEREVFNFAPTLICDRVHWDTVDEFDARQVLSALGPGAYSRQWSDGRHRVWVPVGEGNAARETIRQWCAEHDVEQVNMRVESKVVFRNVDLIPDGLLPELVAATVDWLYPRSYAIRRKIVAVLDLIDDEDVRSMMFLFVYDHVDRFDSGREGANGTLNFTAFMMGKLRTWPQDAARTAYGRAVVSDKVAITRAAQAVVTNELRSSTQSDRASALGTSVTDLRRREAAIATLSCLRNPQSLTVGGFDSDDVDSVELSSEVDVEAEATGYDHRAAVTRAVMSAVNNSSARGRYAQDPLALAAIYLSFWEGLTRQQVARELKVLPKTANAAVNRVIKQVKSVDLR